MARVPSISPPDSSTLAGLTRRTLFEAEISVVTPIFGGAASPGKPDPERAVNAKAIRGHLRFWWRACRGAMFRDARDLFREEESIWGSTENPSAVDLVVEVLNAGSSSREEDVRRKFGTDYALFPFREQKERTPEQKECALERVKFRLLVSVAPHKRGAREAERAKQEVERALWAWLNFGGLGARTRRGCGSLFCEEFAPKGEDLVAAITEKARRFVDHSQGEGGAVPAPALGGARLLLGAQRSDSGQAWRAAVSLMRDFRQGVGSGRRKGADPKRPGRSLWPEADSVRSAKPDFHWRHTAEHPASPFYPRADLGLPIVMHFKGEGPRDSSRDPILEGAEARRTRMASPIILKPLALSTSEAVPIALLLVAPHVWEACAPGVALDGNPLPQDQLHNRTKAALVAPLRVGQASYATAREAFMAFARERLGGGEVVL